MCGLLPCQNPDYSDAVSYFRNTTVPILCGGPMVDPATGLENLCLEPAAQLVCNSNVTHPARMSNPDLTLTDANNQQQLVAAYDQGAPGAAASSPMDASDSQSTLGCGGRGGIAPWKEEPR